MARQNQHTDTTVRRRHSTTTTASCPATVAVQATIAWNSTRHTRCAAAGVGGGRSEGKFCAGWRRDVPTALQWGLYFFIRKYEAEIWLHLFQCCHCFNAVCGTHGRKIIGISKTRNSVALLDVSLGFPLDFSSESHPSAVEGLALSVLAVCGGCAAKSHKPLY